MRKWILFAVALTAFPAHLFAVTTYSLPLPPQANTYVDRYQGITQSKQNSVAKLIVPPTTLQEAVNFKAHNLDVVNYINTHFMQPAEFSLSTIHTLADFKLAVFSQSADFAQANFLKGADFTWADFNGNAAFSYADFKGPASFYSVKFLKPVSFFSAEFSGDANFQFTDYHGTANFAQNIFLGNMNFHKSLFHDATTFQLTQFGKFADFEFTMFLGLTNFTRAKFLDEVNFSHAEFLGRALFYEVTLPRYMNFSDAEIKKTIDLTTALPNTTNARTDINLLHTDISKIKLRYSMFKLYFPPNTSTSDISFTYQALMSSLKNNGFEDDYYLAATEFAEYQYLSAHHPILNFIDKYWWNYGFDKPRIFLWILVILFVLTFINALFYEWLMLHAFEVTFLQTLAANRVTQKNCVVRYVHYLPFSLLYTVYIFFGGLIGFKRDADKFKSKNYFVNLYLIFIIVIGLMCTFFVLKNL